MQVQMSYQDMERDKMNTELSCNQCTNGKHEHCVSRALIKRGSFDVESACRNCACFRDFQGDHR